MPHAVANTDHKMRANSRCTYTAGARTPQLCMHLLCTYTAAVHAPAVYVHPRTHTTGSFQKYNPSMHATRTREQLFRGIKATYLMLKSTWAALRNCMRHLQCTYSAPTCTCVFDARISGSDLSVLASEFPFIYFIIYFILIYSILFHFTLLLF